MSDFNTHTAVIYSVVASLENDQQGWKFRRKMDYDGRADDQPVYVGSVVYGTATSASGWRIAKLTYDGSDRVTDVSLAEGTWDGRAALSYA